MKSGKKNDSIFVQAHLLPFEIRDKVGTFFVNMAKLLLKCNKKI
jgi:hypothetical protein